MKRDQAESSDVNSTERLAAAAAAAADTKNTQVDFWDSTDACYE